ncbi:MAG: hypothetical protein IKU55_04045 [Clostridia bacterium]|nr:hypothetical protein [Clostridia bacterium]
MTTHKLAEALSWKLLVAGEDRKVSGGYCGDLLSWVMGRAPKDSAWITVMANMNVAAVAVLCDVACVIFAQGSQPDATLCERAKNEGLTLLTTDEDTYTAAVRLQQVLGTVPMV